MTPSFFVVDIAGRAGVPIRKVRYVLEQGVMPGFRGRPTPGRAGAPLSFLDFEAFAIAAAAVLLHGGVQRGVVTAALVRLADAPWPLPGLELPAPTLIERAVGRPRSAIEALYKALGGRRVLRIGDGVNLRLEAGEVDTGWVEPRTFARLAPGYAPRVLVEFDAAGLAAAFGPPPARAARPPRRDP